MKLSRLIGVCLLATLVACGDDEPQPGAVNNDSTIGKIDVSAALKNILEQSANYQVSLTIGRDVTRVDLTIRPDDDTEIDGQAVMVSKTVNQTTAPNGFVSEATTLTQWDTNPDNDNRVRIRRLIGVEAGFTTDVLSNANLPDPVQVNTNGSFYDGAVNEGTVRRGIVEVRWSVESNTAETAWVCLVGKSNFSTIVSKECYLVNPDGQLQGSYRSESDDGNVRLVFQ